MLIEREEKQQNRESASAFSLAYLSWYYGAAKKLGLSKLSSYLEKLGLKEKEVRSREELQEKTEKAIEKSQDIIDMMGRG